MTMMEINWMKGSGSEVANYYFEGADYYLENGVESAWHGKYHTLLGLTGNVTRDDLKAVLNNRNPLGGKITQRDVAGRRAGLEIVFSAPKSLSIMDAIAGDKRIRQAFDNTVHLTMQQIEKDAQRRLRSGGMEGNITTGNIIYAAFPHKLGRPVNGVPDPQMHTHVLLANCTYDKNTAKWYALEAGQIVKDAPYYQAFFRMALAKQLEGMGYKLDYENGSFEIHGITKQMRDTFSNRTKQVEEAIDAYGFTRDDSKAKVGAMTREKKNDNHTWEQLQQLWVDRLTQKELQTIRDIFVQSLGYGVRDKPDFSAKYIDKAMDELTHKDTWVTERRVMTRAMQEGLGKVSMEGMQEHINHMVQRGRFIRRKDKQEELTTKKAKDKMIEVIDLWKQGMGRLPKFGRDTYNVKDPSHLQALNKLFKSRDRFTRVRGNIKRADAIKHAQKALNAGIANTSTPEQEVWFITAKVPDGDLPDLMQKAVDRDARIVFWEPLGTNDVDEALRLQPIELFDRQSKQTVMRRMEQFIINMIRRNRDALEERRDIEQDRGRSREPAL